MKNKFYIISIWLAVLNASADYATDKTIGTAFSSVLFDGVHVIDIKASTQAWVDSLGEKHQIAKAGPVQIYDDATSLSVALENDRFQIGILSATQFLQVKTPELMEPIYVPGNGGDVLQNMLLLVRRESDIHSIEALRNKSILFPINRYSSIAQFWIDTLLMEHQLAADHHSYFGTVKNHEKTTCVVLPVFFGKCDACIVSKRTYDLMCELNPQIGKTLMALETSPPYLASLICIRKDSNPEVKSRLGSAVSSLHQSVDGAHVLMSFHVDRYEPYQQGQLETTKALLEHYAKLKADYGN